ncbi:hypothetical protein Ahy_B01g054831 isoform B [Arachis hypogaea]|uniref:Uncharacterized protein n=1 Tax=Arachis hypogaea TaxID=3818 RepID=A0A445AUJ0_ARAHY|nr:hypothetical protein Ahy_B01g054831 isoform B [Arachis hypogaea]
MKKGKAPTRLVCHICTIPASSQGICLAIVYEASTSVLPIFSLCFAVHPAPFCRASAASPVVFFQPLLSLCSVVIKASYAAHPTPDVFINFASFKRIRRWVTLVPILQFTFFFTFSLNYSHAFSPSIEDVTSSTVAATVAARVARAPSTAALNAFAPFVITQALSTVLLSYELPPSPLSRCFFSPHRRSTEGYTIYGRVKIPSRPGDKAICGNKTRTNLSFQAAANSSCTKQHRMLCKREVNDYLQGPPLARRYDMGAL